MDGALKELDKIVRLTSSSLAAPGKSRPVNTSLDSLLQTLQDYKNRLQAGALSESELQELPKIVDARKKEVDDRQKELYGALAKYGKALDKKFPTPLPTYDPLFYSEEAEEALENVIAIHFLRTGRFALAETFIEDFNVDISTQLKSQFIDLHRILVCLRNHDIGPALEWAANHRTFLESRSSPLEFYLHRYEYLRILVASDHPNPEGAIAYSRKHIAPFFPQHRAEFQRLMTCLMYQPLDRLQHSPYADLASASVHHDLEPMFATEFSANLGMSKQAPLRVVADIGGGGALAKIEKGRKIMRERKSEWSQTDELPVSCHDIDVSLPPEHRYHSVFACPVSKDQTTDTNPPMMLTCGHVLAKDSLVKLGKGNGRVKCSYCPVESQTSQALRVYF
ncbi:CTLH/CRA C-terminal to lish motif domain-containing protein [Amylostereum chailletii]|nr:CTLH/CRA C-terminal to lish motif domain-containing protein [Amylostereum chailletii]